MENCGEAHAAVVAAVSATSEAVDTLKQETSKIFDLLAVVQHDLTEALTKAQFRADSIAVLGVRVEDINHKIEKRSGDAPGTTDNRARWPLCAARAGGIKEGIKRHRPRCLEYRSNRIYRAYGNSRDRQ